jgi:hypothetical protein
VDVWNGTLLINTGDGLMGYHFDGSLSKLTERWIGNGTAILKGDDVEVLGTQVYLSGVSGDYRILEIGHDGRWLSSTLPTVPDIYAVGFTALPDGAFAVLDNDSDLVYILAPDGSPRATIPIPDPHPLRQVLDGLVVGNRLVVSETGKGQIFEVDLDTYETSIFLTFPEPGGFLGAIGGDGDGTFHVYRYHPDGHRVFSFTEGGAPRILCTLPEQHISGLVSVGSYLFAALNHAGTVYRINRFTGEFEKILDGLNWPTDIEYLPLRLGGS